MGRRIYLPSSDGGRAAKYEALERTCARSWIKRSGRSLTMMIPREDGPKASVRVSKETVPGSISEHSMIDRVVSSWGITIFKIFQTHSDRLGHGRLGESHGCGGRMWFPRFKIKGQTH